MADTEKEYLCNPLTMEPDIHQRQFRLQEILLINERLDEIIDTETTEDTTETTEDTTKVVDSIHDLHEDCLIYIFGFLSIMDRLSAEAVCRDWKVLSRLSWQSMKILDFSPLTWGLREIEIDSMTTYDVHRILLRCGFYLKEIDLSTSVPDYLTADILSIVGELCPNLRTIDSDQLVTLPVHINALMNCTKLTKVILNTWVIVKNIERSLQNFLENAKKLKYFKLLNAYVTGKCLLYLSKQTIHTLILDTCRVSDTMISAALVKLRNLRRLEIIDCRGIGRRTIRNITQHCENLIILKLNHLSNVVMTAFDHCNLLNLEILTIKHNYSVTKELLYNIVLLCPSLIVLNVKDCPVSDDDVCVIRHVQNNMGYHIQIQTRYMDPSRFTQDL